MKKIVYYIWQIFDKKVDKILDKNYIKFFDPLTFRVYRMLSRKLASKNIIENNAKKIEKVKDMIRVKRHPETVLTRIDSINSRIPKLAPKTQEKKITTNNDQTEEKYTPPTRTFKQVVALEGFFYTGSSAILSLFNEFNNSTIIGFPENIYNAAPIKDCGQEIMFFKNSNLFRFAESFKNDNLTVKDVTIKNFIKDIYNCYEKKRVGAEGQVPQIYNKDFLHNSIELLEATVELDEFTKTFMKGKKYPVGIFTPTDAYNGCCFNFEEGFKQYIFYKFKDITQEEFDSHIKKYICNFLNTVKSKDILVCDQILDHKTFDNFCKYIDFPLKHICVYRDPRDSYIASFRRNITWYCPREVSEYAKFFKQTRGIEYYMQQKNENRLMIRFEDLVLKYDETVKQIMEFVGVDLACHIDKFKNFDPKISCVNIGAYKYFQDQETMKQIEEQLSEYCYYPEKENLSNNAWDMLKANNFTVKNIKQQAKKLAIAERE